MARKTKTIKKVLFNKGERVDFDVAVLELVGNWMSKLSIYKDDEYPAYFEADTDYEIIIRPKQ